MLKIVGILALVGLIAGAAFASAASIGGIEPNTLQGGIAHVEGDPDGVALEYLTHFAGDAESYVYGIKVTDVDAPEGSWVLVGLFSDPEWPIQPGACMIAMLRGDVEAGKVATIDEIYSGGWVSWTLNNGVKAEDITAVSIVIKSTSE